MVFAPPYDYLALLGTLWRKSSYTLGEVFMQVFDLSGNWQAQNEASGENLPAEVPGCIHLDLLRAGKIANPYFRDNEKHLQWIGQTDWRYSRDFDVPAEILAYERVLLRCEGLDTLASLSLNGRRIAKTDNMFRTWEFEVKRRLRRQRNRLEIRFAAAETFANRQQAKRRLPTWGGGGRSWLRKEPCNFGWDWGPTLITCGIWRPIRLLAFSQARLAEVMITQDHSRQGAVELCIDIRAETWTSRTLAAAASLSYNGEIVAEADTALKAGRGRLCLTVKKPHLWWPRNLGEQPLYEVMIELLDAEGGLLDAAAKRIGLRTLRLDRHQDRWGESFQFVANGVPFFAKGANWVPADTFAPAMTAERYRYLLESAIAANMNMLRVWGGGIYEDDVFYDICDDLGICIWQDFMFACSTYPTFDKKFMSTVAAEAEENVRRLRHHACLALWCGNNELEQGLVGDKWNDHQMSWKDYSRLFDDLLPRIVKRLDPERDYWPSSPHTPPPGDRRNFNDPQRGDAHLWEVWHGRKPFEWYRTCEHRFNSEFGFQSFPEPKTVHAYTAPADRNITSPVMEHHQRSWIGNAAIITYMLDWFRLPKDFDSLLWLSQILQAMAMKYAVEHWRRSMPRGMGTLYWQLNDCWPVASWSSIDSHGRWKALHYLARHFYAPLLVSGLEDTAAGTVAVHATNDLRQACRGEITWRVTDVAGHMLRRGCLAARLPGGKSLQVASIALRDLLAEYGPANLLVWLALRVGGRKASSNLVLFARPKQMDLCDPGIRMRCRTLAQPANSFAVTLTAQHPALWTWLELAGHDATCSDNFIHLAAREPTTIIVTPRSRCSLASFKRRLRARSLWHTYTGR